MEEAKKYCIWCKKENKLGDTLCVECHKPLDPQEHLFLDYLKSHIKDSLKEKVEDTAYSIIKNYLLSHLYGALVVLSIVISTGMVLSGEKVEVTRVTQKPAEILAYYEMQDTVAETVAETVPVTEASTEYDYAEETAIVSELSYNYLNSHAVEAAMRAGYMIGSGEGLPSPADYQVLSDLEYSGKHEYLGYLSEMWGDEILTIFLEVKSINFNPEEGQRELSGQMLQDGYTVAEVIINSKFYDGRPEDGELIAEDDCLIVFVYMDGKWLVAEEVMV